MLDLGHIEIKDTIISTTGKEGGIGTGTRAKSRSYPPRARLDGAEEVIEPADVSYTDSALVKGFDIRRHIDILKVDVEGAEWDSFAAFVYSEPIAELLKRGIYI